MRRLRSESGFGLPELLIAMSLLAVVLLATVKSLDSFGAAARRNFDQNEAQSIARSSVDRLARELRNAASPGTTNTPLERATSYDLAFLSVDPLNAGSGSNPASVQRVRYCVDTSSVLWRQVQTWTGAGVPALSSVTGCPDAAFGAQAKVATKIVNRSGTPSRPFFTFDSSTLTDVRTISVDVYVDKDTTRAPYEQRLTTTVYLRNQNRAPVAGFTGTATGSQHVLLNASSSSDPDGDTLTYTWYDGTSVIGSGAVLDYASPTTGAHTFSVKVTDLAGLNNTSPGQTVNVS